MLNCTRIILKSTGRRTKDDIVKLGIADLICCGELKTTGEVSHTLSDVIVPTGRLGNACHVNIAQLFFIRFQDLSAETCPKHSDSDNGAVVGGCDSDSHGLACRVEEKWEGRQDLKNKSASTTRFDSHA